MTVGEIVLQCVVAARGVPEIEKFRIHLLKVEGAYFRISHGSH